MPEEFFSPVFDTKTPPVYRYFDGVVWKESTSGKTTPIVSPIDGQVMAYTQAVTPEEVDEVMEAASKAQSAWEHIALHKRVAIVRLAADWIRHYEEYLTSLMTREIGKTHDEAKGEIVRTADLIDYYAQEAQSIRGETLDSDNFTGF
jgi:acyl-CoA reductase-like NAD-dependent aldehyde dehydrogenase